MTTTSADQLFSEFRATADGRAFALAVEMTWKPLFRFALYRTRNPHDAEDLVQSTFLAALESSSDFDPQRSLENWLAGILHNRIRNHLRRRRFGEGDADENPAPGPGPEDEAEIRELNHGVTRAIEALEQPYRDVAYLSVVEGLTSQEIAERLGRDASTVRTQLQRGLTKVRGALKGAITLTTVSLLGAEGLSAAVLGSYTNSQLESTGTAGSGSSSQGMLGRMSMRYGIGLVVAAMLTVSILWSLDWFAGATNNSTSPVVSGANAPIAKVDSVGATEVPGSGDRSTAPAAAMGTIDLVVIDAATGRPLAGTPLVFADYRRGDRNLFGAFDRGGWTSMYTSSEGGASLALPVGEERVVILGADVDGDMPRATAAIDAHVNEIKVSGVVRLRGSVTRYQGGPIPGARIWLSLSRGQFEPGFPIGVTDQFGRYDVAVANLRNEKRVSMWAEGLKWSIAPLTAISATGDVVERDFVLGTEVGTLSVEARDAEGRVRRDASASLYVLGKNAFGFAARHRYSTLASGLEFCGVDPGRYALIVRCPGFSPKRSVIEIGNADQHEVVSLTRCATVFGKFDPAKLGSPPHKFYLEALPAGSWGGYPYDWVRAGAMGMMDSAGAFRMEVQTGKSMLALHTLEGPQVVRERLQLEPGQRMQWQPSFAAPVPFRGRVVDVQGEPARGMGVSIGPTSYRWTDFGQHFMHAQADDQGRFSFPVCPFTEFDVWLTRRDTATARVFPTRIVRGVRRDIGELLVKSEAEDTPSAYVRGVVQVSDSPEINHLWVYSVGAGSVDRYPLTKNKAFDLGPFPAGDYDFGVGFNGLAVRWFHRVRLTSGESTDLGEIRPGRGAELKLESPAGELPSMGEVRIRGPIGWHDVEFSLNREGRFPEAKRLPPGECTVFVFGPSFAPIRRDLVLQEGEVSVFRFETTPARSCALAFDLGPMGALPRELRLVVRSGGGKALVDSRWSAEALAAKPTLGLAPGDYEFAVTSSWGGQAQLSVRVEEGVGSQVIEIPVR